MKNFWKYTTGFLAIAFVIALLFIKCDRETGTVVTEEKTGTFEPVTNVPNLPEPTAPDTARIKGATVYIPNKRNQELLDLYLESQQAVSELLKQKDSLSDSSEFWKEQAKQLQMYADAIAEHSQVTEFDNNDLYLKMSTTTQGNLLSIRPEYTIKRDTIPVKKPRSFYLGGGFGTSTKAQNAAAKGSIMYGDRRGNVFGGAYDTDQRIWGTYHRKFDF